jgi:hypothetical protein
MKLFAYFFVDGWIVEKIHDFFVLEKIHDFFVLEKIHEFSLRGSPKQ